MALTTGTPQKLNPQFPTWIKPMTIGGIVDQSLKLYRRNFTAFFLIAITCQIPTIVSQIILPSTKTGRTGMLTAIATILSLVAGVLTIWGTGAIISLGSENFLGRNINFGQAASQGRQKLWSLIVAGFMYGLILFVPMMIIGIFASFLVPSLIKSQNFIMIAILAAVGIVAIAFYVNFLVSFSLYNQAVVLENNDGYDSLQRSRTLIRERTEQGLFKNNIWRLSVIYLVVFALWGAVYAAPSIPQLFLKLGTLDATSIPPWTKGVSQIIAAIGRIFAFPISILAMTVFYYDIRIRKEGLDMELRASALNSQSDA